jgi:hypothetical protein
MVITTGILLTAGFFIAMCAVTGGLRPLPASDRCDV